MSRPGGRGRAEGDHQQENRKSRDQPHKELGSPSTPRGLEEDPDEDMAPQGRAVSPRDPERGAGVTGAPTPGPQRCRQHVGFAFGHDSISSCTGRHPPTGVPAPQAGAPVHLSTHEGEGHALGLVTRTGRAAGLADAATCGQESPGRPGSPASVTFLSPWA